MGLTDEKPSFLKNPALTKDVAAGILATFAFFLSAMVIPVAGIAIGVFTPLPALVFYYRWGSPRGYWVPVGSAFAGGLLLHFLDIDRGIPYFLEMVAVGLFLGIGMRRQWSAEKVIGGAGLFVCMLGAVVFWASYTDSPGGLLQYLEEDLQRTVAATFQHYGTFNLEKDSLENAIRDALPTVVRLLPGISISSALVTCWLNVLVARRYCRLRAIELPSGPEWALWKAPEQFVWVVIAGGFSLLLPYAVSKAVALNLLVVLTTVYLFQGYAIAAFFFERWKLPRVLRAVIYSFFLLQQFATLAAALTGFFDVWLDFRRLSQKPASDV